ncbi:Sel1 domain-containing protein [Ceratobasidium sp. AG-Ba]|nr:Sel1 domain-containing protein [Ceratobasidium sp. AG-Ba]
MAEPKSTRRSSSRTRPDARQTFNSEQPLPPTPPEAAMSSSAPTSAPPEPESRFPPRASSRAAQQTQARSRPSTQFDDGQSRPFSQFENRPSTQQDRGSQYQNEDGASVAGSRSGPRNSQYPTDPPLSPNDPDPFFTQQAATPQSQYAQSVAPSGRQITQPPAGVRAPSPPPLLDHSHLRPGKEANLLSHERTLELYRANARKSNDPDVQFEFAVFMIDASKSLPLPPATGGNQIEIEKVEEKREELTREGVQLLKRLADRGHGEAQYFLADCMANGIGTYKSRQDFDRAYPMFVLAAKHGHADAAYRAGTCCENGWGCRRESAKAVQFFRKAAAALHPGALYRLGIAELNGELGLSKRPKEGVKWLKRSAEHATAEFPHALHELALLHERGVENVLFVDYEYSAELLAQASELGYAPSAYRLGECYEYGKMGCPQDAALSIHYYNIAAQQDHRDACFALTAWYLVGSPGVLPQSDTEAYLWAKKAAEQGLAKAMYAVGYFSEVGVGTVQSLNEAMHWYKRAAEAGDKRAMQRLKTTNGGPLPGSVISREQATAAAGGKDKKDCVIM